MQQEKARLVEALIMAAGGRAEHVRTVVIGHGVEKVAEVVVDEVCSRCQAPTGEDVVVQLDLRFDNARSGHVLEIGHGRVQAKPGRADRPSISIEQDLVDLVFDVVGPARSRVGATRRVLTDVGDTPATPGALGVGKPWWTERTETLGRTAHAVVAACGPQRPDLGELAVRFGSDKWGGLHWFTQHYERHFAALRDHPLRLLEIGIGGYVTPNVGGASLRMWKRYFHRGMIFGIDKFDKSPLDEQRIKTIEGDQGDPEFLTRMAGEHGPFDIVIDDGSHVNAHQITSFRTLLPFVRPGGWYVVEDLETSYWPGFGGSESGDTGPDTAAGILRALVDGLHHEEAQVPGRTPSYTDRMVSGIHFHRNIAFVEKGLNGEPSLPEWIPRAPVF